MPEHVAAMAEGVTRHLPGVPMVCLSDVAVPCERIALQHGWPGWFAKMELFAPHVKGDLLYLDLDSVVAGSLADLAALDRLTLLSDFYRPEMANTGVMVLPEKDRAEVWDAWTTDPDNWMRRAGPYGDGFVLRETVGAKAARIQDAVPGQVVSYKAHVRKSTGRWFEKGNGTVPDGARLVCFHGQPRPWSVEM